MKIVTVFFLGYEGKEALKKAFQEALQDGFQEALKEAFQGKEALKETLQEALQETFKEALKEAFREALRVQELRSFVPLYGRDESFCHGGDGDRALCSQVGFSLALFIFHNLLNIAQANTIYSH